MTSVVTLGDDAHAWLSRPMPRMSVRRAAGPARGRSARAAASLAASGASLPSWASVGARAALGFAVVAAAGALAVAVVPDGSSRTATELAVAAAAPLAVLAGVRLNKPDSRRPWLLLAGALTVFLAADAASHLADWADGVRLAGYPLLLAALAAVHQARRSGPSWPGLVDSAVVATTAALGYWVFVVDLDGADRRWTAVQLGFLVGDVLAPRPRDPAGRRRRAEPRLCLCRGR